MKRLCSPRTLAVLSAVLGLSALPLSHAATKSLDFNSDPSADVLFDGTADPNTGLPFARWVETGGVTGGYISLTDAQNSRTGRMIIPDIDAGAPTVGFDVSFQVLLGGGSARAADGMSFVWVPAGTAPTGTAEEGQSPGVVVSLDTWDNNGSDTAPAIDVKYNSPGDNGPVVKSAYSTGQREGGRATVGPTTFSLINNRFTPVRFVYKNSFVSVWHDGVELIKDAYAPTVAEAHDIIMSARTGGANENAWVDNLAITTFGTGASYITRVAPNPTLPEGNDAPSTAVVEVDIVDGTTAALANSSVVLKFDDVVVTPSFAKVDTTTTVSYDPPGELAAGSKHTVSLTFGTGVGGATETINYEFTVGPIALDTVFVEAEDHNYDNGKWITDANTGQYPGGAYAGTDPAINRVDYFRTGGDGNDDYRQGEDPNIGTVAIGDNVRAGWSVTTDFKVGWNDPGEWANYTRNFPAKSYLVYARLSSGGGPNDVDLSIVGNANVEDQTVIRIGKFSGPASGGWDTFQFVPLRDAAGQPIVLNMSGEQTIRATTIGGNNDQNYYAFVPTATTTTLAYTTITPGDGGLVRPNEPFKIIAGILDQSSPIAASSVSMTVNGVAVAAVAAKANGVTTISHDQAAAGYGTQFTVVLTYTEAGTVKTKTVVFNAGGGVTRRVFNVGGGIAAIQNSPQYLDNAPDEESVEPWYETPPNIRDNYGAQLIGYVTPTVTANYTFYMSSDDPGILWLSTDDSPANKREIGRQVGWSGYREWTSDGGGNPVANRVSAPIPLVAGQRYYTEAIFSEGGGGDNLSVAWRRPGQPAIVNGDAPISFEMTPFDGMDFDVLNPVALTVKKNVPVNLVTHIVAGPSGPITYQWFKNGVAIPNETGTTLSFAAALADNGAKYKITASLTKNSDGTVIAKTSRETTLTVVDDTTAPVIARLQARDLHDLWVTFDEPVPNTPTSFTIAGSAGVAVIDVAGPNADGLTYRVHTTALTPGTTYTVTVTGATDLSGNTGGSSKTVVPVLTQGLSRFEFFSNIGGGAASDLINSAKFQAEAADLTSYRSNFEGPTGYADNYGSRVSGYFTAPRAGNVVWFVSGDDGINLYMSTDEDPANKKLIAQETSWSNGREWGASSNGGADLASKRSDQFGGSEWPTPNVITVEAGKRYYMEMLQKEGGGGDASSAAFIYEGDAVPANGTGIFGGSALSVIADPVITITSPADRASVTAGTDATITVNPVASSGVAKVEFFANGSLLGQSTVAPYSFTVPSAPVGYYSLTARITDNLGGSFTSPGVTVFVRPPSSANAPKVLYVRSTGGANASDVLAQNHLFGRGYDVYDIAALASAAADAADKKLVVISSTVGSGDVGDKFLNVAAGVVTWENALEDNFLLTGNLATDHATTAGQTAIEITAAGAASPIGAGFTGAVTFTTAANDYGWGLVLAPVNATVIANIVGNTAQNALYIVEKGAALLNGATAAGRRAYVPLTDNTFAILTADGKTLFDRTIDWAAASAVTEIKVSAVKVATGVQVSWTGDGGTGVLYSSATANGTFTPVAGATNGGIIATTDAQAYFLVRKP